MPSMSSNGEEQMNNIKQSSLVDSELGTLESQVFISVVLTLDINFVLLNFILFQL